MSVNQYLYDSMPYVMEICVDEKAELLEDNEVICSEVESGSVEKEVSDEESEIVILPQDYGDTLMDSDGTHCILAVEDIPSGSTDATLSLLSMTNDCGDDESDAVLADDGCETVEVKSETKEEVLWCKDNGASAVIESTEEEDEVAPFCLLIDNCPYRVVPVIDKECTCSQTNTPGEETTCNCSPTLALQPLQFEVNDGVVVNDVENDATVKLKSSKSSKGKKRDKKERVHICYEPGCNRSYTSIHHLRAHLLNHLGIRPYSCPIESCGKAFSTMYSCTAHIRTHTGEKPYTCSSCTKGFKTSGDLQKHIRTHTGERPFKCPVEGCNKAFTTSNIRKIHIRCHTGEKPFVCGEKGCDKKFSSSTNYKNHMRIHSGEKPFACSVNGCLSRFTEYSSLYKHRKVHSQKELTQSMKSDSSKDTNTAALLSNETFKVLTAHLPRRSQSNHAKAKHTAVKKSTNNNVKEWGSSFTHFPDDTTDDLEDDTLNMPFSEDNFEVYELIFDDKWSSKMDDIKDGSSGN